MAGRTTHPISAMATCGPRAAKRVTSPTRASKINVLGVATSCWKLAATSVALAEANESELITTARSIIQAIIGKQ